MSASNFLENALLNHIFRNTSYTPPVIPYIGLFTGTAGTNLENNNISNEVTGNGYLRRTVSFTLASGTEGTIKNGAQIVFPTATASWGNITHIAILDASTGGNVLVWGSLSPSVTINASGTLTIPINGITVVLN